MLRFLSPKGGIASAVAVRPRFRADFIHSPEGDTTLRNNGVLPSGLRKRNINQRKRLLNQ